MKLFDFVLFVVLALGCAAAAFTISNLNTKIEAMQATSAQLPASEKRFRVEIKSGQITGENNLIANKMDSVVLTFLSDEDGEIVVQNITNINLVKNEEMEIKFRAETSGALEILFNGNFVGYLIVNEN